jgi:hypothetical protein
MSGFKRKRPGLMMEAEPGNPQEIEGVLNPAETPGRRSFDDGAAYRQRGRLLGRTAQCIISLHLAS